MAYYDAFVAAWNSPTQPPAGVTGVGLTPSMTTQQKLGNFNAWTVTGAVPSTLFTTIDQIVNCINYAEFKALTQVQETNLLALFSIPGNLLGGSANAGLLLSGMLLDYFPHAGPTITALTALAKGITEPWWQANGYPRPFDMGDCQAAGVS